MWGIEAARSLLADWFRRSAGDRVTGVSRRLLREHCAMDDQPGSRHPTSGDAVVSTSESAARGVPAATGPGAGERADEDGATASGGGQLDALGRAVEALRERFDKHIDRNDVQGKAFDTLHAELQGYKNSFLLNELHKPVIRNLVALYDSFLRLEEVLPAVGGRDVGPPVDEFVQGVDKFVRNMRNFRVELREVLARLDVETYEDRHDALQAERLGTLDRKLHRPVEVESISDPDRHNRVVRVHKQGFYWRGRVFRPAEVTILQHMPGSASDGGDDDG